MLRYKNDTTSIEQPTEQWFTEGYDYEPPQRGQLRQGVILKIEENGITIDIGLKRDGFVPRSDVERLDEETIVALKPGREVTAHIVQPGELDSNHLLSLYQARQAEDWQKAQNLLEKDELWEGEVSGYNRGGLLVKVGSLQAFVPGSHLSRQGQRWAKLKDYVGQKIPLKVIEVDQARNRLICSERLAHQQIQAQNMERLLNELVEGQICRGTVRRLCDFGAFVDLGGAEGLLHNSELAWQKVRHPSQVLQVGAEIEVYILHLDHERKRIGLSLKRLQPDPWTLAQQIYTVDQLVKGVVTHLVDFGIFVALDIGVEGLAHISELAEPAPQTPQEVAQPGDELVLRILSIEPSRQRLGLSLKRVSEQERREWLAQQANN